MKELALKKSQSIASPSDSETTDHTNANPTSLKRIFHGWLREVSPRRLETREDADVGLTRLSPSDRPDQLVTIEHPGPRNLKKGTPSEYQRKILTKREELGLNRATLRESATHRYWPREVVLKFLAADVVTSRFERH